MSSKPTKVDFSLVPYEKLVAELEARRAEGYDSVGFLGGDVSIHPRMLDVVARAKALGYADVQVITNAMVFADAARAAALVEAGVTRVNVSVHSHLPAVEDFLTQIPGGLARKLAALQNFGALHASGKLRAAVAINIVLNRQNCPTVAESCLFFAKKLGIRDIRINFVWPEYSLGEFVDDIALKYSDFVPHLRRMVAVSVSENIRLTFDTVPPCVFKMAFPDNYRALLPRFLGEQFDFIDRISVVGTGDGFSWKERKRDELKYRARGCAECVFEGTCDGVWREYVELFGFRELKAIPRGDGDGVDRLGLRKGAPTPADAQK